MANSRTFEVKFIGNTKGLSQSFRDLQKDAGILSKGVSSASSIMRTALAGVSFVALARGAQQAVMAASNLSESIAKANTVFSNNKDAINEWSKTTSKAFGVNRQAALEAAGTYGNLFQAFGVSQAEAYKMSTSLVELAADMASFNNVPIEQALTALRAGLSGEAEPLKRFGVGMNEARLKAEAAAMGLGTFTGTLPPAIRMQAAYALVLKDTALQQGDVARTSDGLANQMKFLQAGLADAKAGFGELLLPVVLDFVTVLNERLLPALGRVIEALKMNGAGAGLKQAKTEFSTFIGTLDGTAKKVKDLILLMIGTKVAITSIAAVRVAWAAVATQIGATATASTIAAGVMKKALISTGWGALAVAIGYVISKLVDTTISADATNASLQKAFSGKNVQAVVGLSNAASYAATNVAAIAVNADALAQTRAGDKLLNINKNTLVLGKTVSVTKDAIADLTAGLGGAGGKGGASAAADAAKAAIDQFKDSLNGAKGKLADAQNAFKEFATSVSRSISDTLNFNDAISNSRQSVKDAAEASAKLTEAQAAYQKAMSTNNIEEQARALEDLQIAQENATASVTNKKSFMQVLQEQAAKANEFGTKVKDLIRMGLSESAIQQVLAAGADAGTAIADEIIAGGATVVDQVNTLVTATQSIAEQVGQAGASQFYSAGVAQGEALVQGIVDAIKAAGFTIQGTAADTIAQAAKAGVAAAAPAAGTAKSAAPKKSSSVKKPTVTKAPSSKTLKIPMMAKGGVVTAPTLAMIGEAGPEAVVPLNRSGGVGSTVNITVNAGMGADGAAIGREIVDAIKRYERTSGPVFASA